MKKRRKAYHIPGVIPIILFSLLVLVWYAIWQEGKPSHRIFGRFSGSMTQNIHTDDVTLPIRAVGVRGVGGSMKIWEANGAVVLVFDLDTPVGASYYPAWIRKGTCPAPKERKYALSPVLPNVSHGWAELYGVSLRRLTSELPLAFVVVDPLDEANVVSCADIKI